MAQNLRLLPSILSLVLFTSLVACNKAKNTGIDIAGSTSSRSSSDAAAAVSGDGSKTVEDCKKSTGDDDSKAEDEADDKDEDLDLKTDKAKDDDDKKECPVPGTGTSTTTSGTASLELGQKLYATNCQGCHGALPGAKQGATAEKILGASTVGSHKGISPWPAGAGSTLSSQDAAASLAAAMK